MLDVGARAPPVLPQPQQFLDLVHAEIGSREALSGRDGTTRSLSGHCKVAADIDREAVLAWLARYADSPNTLTNSRREANGLLLWALIERGKPVSSLTHEELLLYQRFLAAPPPAERCVTAPRRKLPRSHPGWRPLAVPLSKASCRQRW